MSDLLEFDKEHIWHPYSKLPSNIASYQVLSAHGVYLMLRSGARVIDGMSSWWAAIHGYNHPKLNRALTYQLGKMAHVMFGGLTHKSAIILAKKLIDITPKSLSRIFFSDSGSVAVEVAIKIALQYQIGVGKPQKNKLITALGGYHGDTFAAMSLCDKKQGMHTLFHTVLPKHFFAKQPNETGAIDDLEQLFKIHHSEIAAFIIEPIVQGAGGMRIYDKHYLKVAKSLCKRYDVLFIADEIATGFGRTGKLFAIEYANISPDILCLGKALTGGYLSLAATLTSEHIATKVATLMHGPTFMANALACAVANANLDILLNTNWQSKIQRIESILSSELLPLKENTHVVDVRILGAIGVVEMINTIDVNKIQIALIERGVWLRPFGRLLYTMPAFIMTDKELMQITCAMKEVVSV